MGGSTTPHRSSRDGYGRRPWIHGEVGGRDRSRRGIGGALVRALLDAGAERVVAADLATDGDPAGDRVEARALDVSDAPATVALVEDVTAEHGPIDLWFANAGIAGGGGLDAPNERVATAVGRQRDVPRLRRSGPLPGLDRRAARVTS